MKFYSELKNKFQENADSKKAQMLSRYMRDQFRFYGLHTPLRRACYHEFLKEEKKKKVINWPLLDQAWEDNYREFQYFVCDYLIVMKKYLSFDDMKHLEKFARSKQWWDTIDSLIKPIGDLGLRDARINEVMLEWSQDSDFWIRRIAIEHQLLRKDKMDTDLLSKIIMNNLDSKEFFNNKAIGWVLRDYSKTNPRWVEKFIKENRSRLAPLSIKEGSKYIYN